MKKTTLSHLQQLKQQRQKITCLTAYDASFAQAIDQAGVNIILVGDSLGMVIQGHASTLPVSVEQMIYHAQNVQRACKQALLLVDMPFMSYASVDKALHNATRLMAEGLAEMVKIEGGDWTLDIIHALSQRGIPVCAHLGLTPQSVHQLGGYKIQGRATEQAQHIAQQALAVEQAGASLLVLECVPAPLAKHISQQLKIPVIGIGAGQDCDGQVLVLYDILNISAGKKPFFSQDFLQSTGSIQGAISAFVTAVKNQQFPTDAHCIG